MAELNGQHLAQSDHGGDGGGGDDRVHVYDYLNGHE